MPKLLWVSLPLLIAAGWVALQALRRRAPSRLALNVGSSVLLLGYVLTTAGLGIFWVANQQLPVFDWHYLFGYGTVLLVSLHLAFNFPVVWRYLARSRKASAAARPEALPGRRGALAGFGVLLATGAAFALGLRHGRSELRIEAGAGAGGAAADAATTGLQAVERFHAFSSHSRTGVLLRAPGADWGDPPPAFKRYAGALRVSLPPPRPTSAATLDAAALGTVLWHTTGVTQTRGGLDLRASPSSGALFSTELYVATRKVAGLAAGLWHYDPKAHALERIGEAPASGALAAAGRAQTEAPATVLATAVFGRTGQKYRDRTYRYVLADLGHALENMRAAAEAMGAHAGFLGAFDESSIARALGIDEAEEGVLAVVELDGAPLPAAALATGGAPRWQPRLLSSQATVPRGVTAAVHAATSLRGAERTVGAAAPASRALPSGSIALPSAAAANADVLRVIAARRSVRRYAPAALALDDLAAVLARMTVPAPALSTAVRVHVVAHAVAGLAPGVYRHEPERRALLPRRVPAELRAAARAAALDQDVIGDAAAVFVLSIDRAAFAADPLGPARGYRHAFLEAGLVGERIYLEAVARGLGACAVGAFYDDEAAALVGVDPAREWVVHFAALGVPAGAARAG